MANQIQLRRDTAANWTSTDPVLAQGEMGYETDTNQFKIGDGSTAWSSLTYFSGGGGGASALDDLTDVTITSAATGEVLRYNGSAWVDASLDHNDISDFDTEVDARIAAASIDDLTDVDTTTSAPTVGEVLEWDGTNWVPAAAGGSATSVTLENLTITSTSSTVTKTAGNNIYMDDVTYTTTDSGDLAAGWTAGTGWTVAETGRYQLHVECSPRPTTSGNMRSFISVQVNGGSVTAGSSVYEYNDAEGLTQITNNMVLDLTAGDVVRPYMGVASSSVSTDLRYWQFNVIRLDFDAYLTEEVKQSYVYTSLGGPTINGWTTGERSMFKPISDFGDTLITDSVVVESSDAFWSGNTVDATGLWTPPAGIYRIEAAYGQTDSTTGETRLRLRKNSVQQQGAGRTEVKAVSGEGDQWCQMTWIMEANGTDNFELVVDHNSGTVTVNSCSFNITQILS